MAPINDDLLLRVLKACADAAPLYPARFASAEGIDRPMLDATLDRLRLLGLVELTDWVQGKGQGYRVTPGGAVALRNGRIAPAAPPVEEAPTGRETTWARGEQVRDALLNPKPPVVALVLVLANLAVFVVGIAMAWQRDIALNDYFLGAPKLAIIELRVDTGALFPPDVVRREQYWRLITYQFVHGNLLHIVMNMMALFALGPRLESLWGAKRFLVMYLIAGWVGGCAAVLSGRPVVTMGASGSICGLITSLAVWLWLNRDHLPEEQRAMWARTIGMNLILIVIISTLPSVSWQGHLGGAIGGAAVSVPLHYTIGGSLVRRGTALLGVAAVPALALAVALAPSHWPVVTARWRYTERVTAMDAWIAEQEERVVRPALSRGAEAWSDDADLRDEARAAAGQAQPKLQELIDDLQNATPVNQLPLRQEMLETAFYFIACKNMFEALNRLADHPETWDAGRRVLMIRCRAAMKIRRLLEAHQIMPALSPREPLDIEEAPAPPPPNTVDRRTSGVGLTALATGYISKRTGPHRLVA